MVYHLLTPRGFIKGVDKVNFDIVHTWDIREAHDFVDHAHVHNMARFMKEGDYHVVEVALHRVL